MSIPLHEMQASGEFHVPGLPAPITGNDVLCAVNRLPSQYRLPVCLFLDRGGEGEPPPSAALLALRRVVEEAALNGKRAAP